MKRIGCGLEVTKDNFASNPELPAEPQNPAAASANIPLTSRLAHEIPKPKDWQAFQRSCVLLFQAELKDPNAQEYGRGGQSQRGIDVLGKRNGNPDQQSFPPEHHAPKTPMGSDVYAPHWDSLILTSNQTRAGRSRLPRAKSTPQE